VGNLLFPTANNPIVTSTSIDGGATWSGPTRVSPDTRARVVAPAPAIGPKGELYVAYLDLLDDRLDYAGAHEGRGGEPHPGPWALVLARSTDQGATWGETIVDGDLVPTERFVVFLPPTPSLAVDPASGRLHIAFTDGRLGDADVALWTSSDGGRSFGDPVRVNDTPEGDGRAQYLPRVDVAPGGRLDVVYFDRRNDPGNIRNEVSLQSSFDHGRTFTTQIVLTDQPFSSKVGPGGERELPDLGNRMALVSTERLALAVWTDTRAGTVITQKQDLASAVIEAPRPASTPFGYLRYVGAALVALGLVSIVLGLLSRRSARAPVAAGPGDAGPAGPGSPVGAEDIDPPSDRPREERPAPVATEPSGDERSDDTLVGAGRPAATPPDRSDAAFVAGRPGTDPDRIVTSIDSGRPVPGDAGPTDSRGVDGRPAAEPELGDAPVVAGRPAGADLIDAPAETQAFGDASLAGPLPPAAPGAPPVTVHEPTSWASEAAPRAGSGPWTAVPLEEAPAEGEVGARPQPVPWAVSTPADHDAEATADPAPDAETEEPPPPDASVPTPPALHGIWNRRPGGPDRP